jgi:ERCC4-type nuclease
MTKKTSSSPSPRRATSSRNAVPASGNTPGNIGPKKGHPECPFRIVIDTREQHPYEFLGIKSDASEGGNFLRVETVRLGMKHGDYAVEATPGFCIERKTLADLYGSISQRDNFIGRFLAMSEDGIRGAIVVEAELSVVIESLDRQSTNKRFARFSQDRPTAEAWTFRLLEACYRRHRPEAPR